MTPHVEIRVEGDSDPAFIVQEFIAEIFRAQGIRSNHPVRPDAKPALILDVSEEQVAEIATSHSALQNLLDELDEAHRREREREARKVRREIRLTREDFHEVFHNSPTNAELEAWVQAKMREAGMDPEEPHIRIMDNFDNAIVIVQRVDP